MCAVCHPNPYSREDERILWELRANLKPYLAERSLRPSDPAFNPYSLYSDEGLYIPFCLPVEEAGAGAGAGADDGMHGVRGEGRARAPRHTGAPAGCPATCAKRTAATAWRVPPTNSTMSPPERERRYIPNVRYTQP